jgi:hypothetical protein
MCYVAKQEKNWGPAYCRGPIWSCKLFLCALPTSVFLLVSYNIGMIQWCKSPRSLILGSILDFLYAPKHKHCSIWCILCWHRSAKLLWCCSGVTFVFRLSELERFFFLLPFLLQWLATTTADLCFIKFRQEIHQIINNRMQLMSLINMIYQEVPTHWEMSKGKLFELKLQSPRASNQAW